MTVRSFPLVLEADLRTLIAAGAEIEITCLEEPDKDKRNQGGWLVMVHAGGPEPLVLVSARSRHRVFKHFEGLCAFAAHTLELAEIRVPVASGTSARGMYHRTRTPASR